MKRGSRFLIAFVAAVLTFGSLMTFVGLQHSGWHRYGYYGNWRHYHYHHYYEDADRRSDSMEHY